MNILSTVTAFVRWLLRPEDLEHDVPDPQTEEAPPGFIRRVAAADELPADEPASGRERPGLLGFLLAREELPADPPAGEPLERPDGEGNHDSRS